MPNTVEQFNSIIKNCSDIFAKKMKDYGTSWRIMRLSSITDQLFIKAQRIRSIEEKGFSKVDEGVKPEFIAMVNYCVMGLIQMELGNDARIELPAVEVVGLYEKHITEARDLMLDKNHDYGEAWREMRISSLTDLILMKIYRTKQIEDNDGETLISEGVDANYHDIINYSIFALIRLEYDN